MNTPYQNAKLQGCYRATDHAGDTVLIALFDGTASDGYQTNYQGREVSWCVWVRNGRVVHASRYAGRNRPTAKQEFESLPAQAPDAVDVPEYRGMTWKRWASIAKRDSRREVARG